MALKLGELVAYLRLDDRDFSRKIDQAGTKFQDTGRKISDAGTTLTTHVSLPLAAAGTGILHAAGNFEASMNKVRAVTGATGEELAKMEELAKDLGATTAFSASQAADAMYFLSAAGFDTTETMTALPGVLDLAAAAGIDLAQAADIASNILSGYGMQADQLADVNDKLVKTFQSSNVNVQMLGESFKYVGPVAAGAGLEFNEMAAAIGLLGNAGIQGSEAGTALRGAIARLLSPTKEVTDTLDALGVTVTDSNGNLLQLSEILGQLEAAGANTTDMIKIFGVEAGPGMMAILSQGTDALTDLAGELESAGGTAKEVAEIQMDGFKGGVVELQSAVEGLAIAVADSGLLEWATQLIGKLAGWVQSLSKTNPQMLKLATVIGLVLAALGPTVMIIGKVVSSIGTLIKAGQSLILLIRAIGLALAANPLGLLLTAIGLIITGFILLYQHSETFRNIVHSVLAAVGAAAMWLWENAIQPAWEGIKKAFEVVADVVTWWWENIIKRQFDLAAGAAEWLWDKVKSYFGFWKGVFDTVRDWVTGAVNWVRDKFNDVVDFFRKLPGRIKSGLSNLKDRLLSPFKAAFNAVAGIWNRSLGNISFSVPDWVPGVGGKGWSFPRIPELAQGGIVPATPGGRIVRVAEGGEDEAVIPLPRLEGMLRDALSGEMVAVVPIDLGEGITQVVEVKLRRRDRDLRRRVLAGTGAAR